MSKWSVLRGGYRYDRDLVRASGRVVSAVRTARGEREEQWIDGRLVPYEHPRGWRMAAIPPPTSGPDQVVMEIGRVCGCGSASSTAFFDLYPDPLMTVICAECGTSDEYNVKRCPPEVLAAVRASPWLDEAAAHAPEFLGVLEQSG